MKLPPNTLVGEIVTRLIKRNAVTAPNNWVLLSLCFDLHYYSVDRVDSALRLKIYRNGYCFTQKIKVLTAKLAEKPTRYVLPANAEIGQFVHMNMNDLVFKVCHYDVNSEFVLA